MRLEKLIQYVPKEKKKHFVAVAAYIEAIIAINDFQAILYYNPEATELDTEAVFREVEPWMFDTEAQFQYFNHPDTPSEDKDVILRQLFSNYDSLIRYIGAVAVSEQSQELFLGYCILKYPERFPKLIESITV